LLSDEVKGLAEPGNHGLWSLVSLEELVIRGELFVIPLGIARNIPTSLVKRALLARVIIIFVERLIKGLAE
jgi:hypothetical protein